MTQDEIIEMVRQAGLEKILWRVDLAVIQAFAKLVEERTTAKEREACAALVEREWSTNQEKALCDELASYIRARAKADRGEHHE